MLIVTSTLQESGLNMVSSTGREQSLRNLRN
jgi:hypothetical protein